MTWFRWHDDAQIFAASGQSVARSDTGGGMIADQPSGMALARALAIPGAAFRIAGSDLGSNAPLPAEGLFETLTSGTLGAPRRIVRSQASWTASFAINAALFNIGPGTRVAVLGRLQHSLALYGALEAVHLGAALHLLDDLRPVAQRAALAARHIHILYATPAQLRLLIRTGGVNWPELRLILLGGSKLDAPLRADLSAITKAQIREFYGAAEASFITMANSDAPQTSVGAPYPGVQVQVRTGADVLADGKIGEIWVRSPYLFLGYAGKDAGAAVIDHGWLSVGEMGWFDAGYLYLAGRAGRMVTVADQNVFPEAIEAFLAGLPGVHQVAVLPRTDAQRGVQMVALIKGDRAQNAAILAAGRLQFGPLKAPRALIWCDDWPCLASGKPDLVALARRVKQ